MASTDSNTPRGSSGESRPAEITPQEDENVPPTTATSLVRDGPLPPFSMLSTVPYLSTKLCGKIAYYTMEDLPQESQSLHAEQWKDTKFLKTHFKAPNKKGP